MDQIVLKSETTGKLIVSNAAEAVSRLRNPANTDAKWQAYQERGGVLEPLQLNEKVRLISESYEQDLVDVNGNVAGTGVYQVAVGEDLGP